MLTALGADSRLPRGGVLSLGQQTLEPASAFSMSTVLTGCQQKSLKHTHPSTLVAGSHRLQDGHIVKVVNSYGKLSATQNSFMECDG